MEERPFTYAGFKRFLSEGRLMGSRCTACGEIHLPPRAMCMRCYSTRMEWFPFSGEGRLAGFTVIHVGLPGMVAEGYSRENPYASGVVRLAEGPAISAQIVGAEPGALQVGMEMRLVLVERAAGPEPEVALGFAPFNGT